MRKLLINLIFSLGIQSLCFAHPYIEPLGEHFDFIDQIRGVQVQDDFAFLAMSGSGLGIVDILDPDGPNLISKNDRNTGSAYDIILDETIAFVADYCSGLVIYDVEDIISSEIIAYLDLQGRLIDIEYDGSFIYGATEDGHFYILDVSTVEQPVEIACLRFETRFHQIDYVDDKVFIAGDNMGALIISVEDRHNPEFLHCIEPDSMTLGIGFYQGFLYSTDKSHKLCTYNINNLEDIGLVETIEIRAGLKKLFIFDDQLFTGSNRIYIFDLANPSQPRELASLSYEAEFNNLGWNQGNLQMTMGNNGLSSYNVSNVENIELIYNYVPNGYDYNVRPTRYPSEVVDVAVSENNVFVAAAGSAFHILDATDPGNIDHLYMDEEFHYYTSDISIHENILLVTNWNSGIWLFNVAYPERPTFLGWFSRGFSYDATIQDNYVYCLTGGGLLIGDIHDFENIEERGL